MQTRSSKVTADGSCCVGCRSTQLEVCTVYIDWLAQLHCGVATTQREHPAGQWSEPTKAGRTTGAKLWRVLGSEASGQFSPEPPRRAVTSITYVTDWKTR